jgi:hypothetical protein
MDARRVGRLASRLEVKLEVVSSRNIHMMDVPLPVRSALTTIHCHRFRLSAVDLRAAHVV